MSIGKVRATIDPNMLYYQRGGAWYDDVWSGIKSAHKWVKDNKVISRAGKALGGILPGQYGNAAKTIGAAAEQAGYGRRKKRQVGGAKKRKSRITVVRF